MREIQSWKEGLLSPVMVATLKQFSVRSVLVADRIALKCWQNSFEKNPFSFGNIQWQIQDILEQNFLDV